MNDTYRETRRRVRREFERLAKFGTWEAFIDTGEAAWSPGVYRVLGLPETETPAVEMFRSLIHPEDLPRYTSAMRRLQQDGESFTVDLRITRPDGETRQLQAIGHRTDDPTGDRHRLLGAIQDITDLRRLESDRAELLARLLTTADEERRRLAGRVHDDVVQELAAALYGLEAATDELGPERTEQIRRPITTAVTALRAVLADLAPPDGHPHEFRASIASYAEHVVGRDTEIHLDVGDVAGASPDTLMTALRVVREALSNANRHARANTITVSAQTTDSHLHARIEDDGTGFETATEPIPGHIGLQLMRERTESMGGELRIDSTPGEGTTVSVAVPLTPVATAQTTSHPAAG